MDTAYRILVTGSRYATLAQHGAFIEETLAMARYKGDVLLTHGCAEGVDTICASIAHTFGWSVKGVRADWRLGRRAGPQRNKAMVNLGQDVVLAFFMDKASNRGTTSCVTYATTAGLLVRRFTLAARA